MEPMKPMQPMEPMRPMEPMKPMQMQPMQPMDSGAPWWPGDLGQPSTSGAQNGTRYAFFPDARRLAVEDGGQVTVYDTGEHRIGGVSQQQSGSGRGAPRFTSQQGDVDLSQLRQVK